MESHTRPRVQFLGPNGTSEGILKRAEEAGRAAGWSEARIQLFKERAESGGVAQELATIYEFFDVVDKAM